MSGDASTKYRRPGFSLFGLLLVAFGALVLLTVTGLVGLGVWFEFARYWPVLLILIGIKLILAPRAPLVGVVVVSIAMAATIVAAWIPLSIERSDDLVHIAYSTPLENTETLELGMGFTSGRVALRSDPSGDRLFAVDFNQRPAEVIYDHSGRFSKIYLSVDGFSIDYSDDGGANGYTLTGLADWDLMVSPEVALDLDIRAGAADLDLDLTHLNVRRVFVGAGASEIRIRLPESGWTQVEIEAGAADIEITVPQGVAARIENDSFLNFTSIDSTRFPKSDGEHRSPDYFTAENRVDIEIDAGAANVTVG